MAPIETTKMSSKGQVVIPEEIRHKLGLKTGDRFLVIGDRDVVIFKTLSKPSLNEFEGLIRQARRQGKAAGLKRGDVAGSVSESRERV